MDAEAHHSVLTDAKRVRDAERALTPDGIRVRALGVALARVWAELGAQRGQGFNQLSICEKAELGMKMAMQGRPISKRSYEIMWFIVKTARAPINQGGSA